MVAHVFDSSTEAAEAWATEMVFQWVEVVGAKPNNELSLILM